MMGMMFVIYAIPVLSLALVAWAVASRRLSDGPRRAAMVAAILLACGVLTLVRTDGISGGGSRVRTGGGRRLPRSGSWPKPATSRRRCRRRRQQRRRPSGAARGQAGAGDGSRSRRLPAAAAEAGTRRPLRQQRRQRADWPGFRGPERDGIVRGVRIETDWSASPPVELWRRPIGPGWSSFAVRGDLLYTQEQRGDDEIVACYKVSTGEPVWRHRDAVRFWESNGGAGPRATPTLSNGRVYTFGATGILNALDAAYRRRRLVAQRRVRHRQRRFRTGASRARRWWSTTSSSSPSPARSPPTTSPPASRAGSARRAAGATARRIGRRSTASRRSCC